jgi:hypothetical protein
VSHLLPSFSLLTIPSATSFAFVSYPPAGKPVSALRSMHRRQTKLLVQQRAIPVAKPVKQPQLNLPEPEPEPAARTPAPISAPSPPKDGPVVMLPALEPMQEEVQEALNAHTLNFHITHVLQLSGQHRSCDRDAVSCTSTTQSSGRKARARSAITRARVGIATQ